MMAVSLSETVGSLAVEVTVRVPVCAVLCGLAITFTVRVCPGDNVAGRDTAESEKTPFENEMFWMVTDRRPVEVMVKGWDETLPLEPLKLSAAVERLMFPLVC